MPERPGEAPGARARNVTTSWRCAEARPRRRRRGNRTQPREDNVGDPPAPGVPRTGRAPPAPGRPRTSCAASQRALVVADVEVRGARRTGRRRSRRLLVAEVELVQVVVATWREPAARARRRRRTHRVMPSSAVRGPRELREGVRARWRRAARSPSSRRASRSRTSPGPGRTPDRSNWAPSRRGSTAGACPSRAVELAAPLRAAPATTVGSDGRDAHRHDQCPPRASGRRRRAGEHTTLAPSKDRNRRTPECCSFPAVSDLTPAMDPGSGEACIDLCVDTPGGTMRRIRRLAVPSWPPSASGFGMGTYPAQADYAERRVSPGRSSTRGPDEISVHGNRETTSRHLHPAAPEFGDGQRVTRLRAAVFDRTMASWWTSFNPRSTRPCGPSMSPVTGAGSSSGRLPDRQRSGREHLAAGGPGRALDPDWSPSPQRAGARPVTTATPCTSGGGSGGSTACDARESRAGGVRPGVPGAWTADTTAVACPVAWRGGDGSLLYVGGAASSRSPGRPRLPGRGPAPVTGRRRRGSLAPVGTCRRATWSSTAAGLRRDHRDPLPGGSLVAVAWTHGCGRVGGRRRAGGRHHEGTCVRRGALRTSVRGRDPPTARRMVADDGDVPG